MEIKERQSLVSLLRVTKCRIEKSNVKRDHLTIHCKYYKYML